MFPPSLQAVFKELGRSTLLSLTEIRLRRDKPIIIYMLRSPLFISSRGKPVNHYSPECVSISSKEFDFVTDAVCSSSFHTNVGSMLRGYVTTDFGCRVGIASKAVYRDGALASVKDITALNIRISREIPDCSRPVLNMLYVGQTPSIIVAGPPSSGKTTFLRDAARLLSSGFAEKYRKVAVIDEREEIAADYNVGLNTDVIRSFGKAQGIENAVRSLSPEIIICDEIGNDNELQSIKFGFSSGVSFIVTVHAKSREDLLGRSIIKKLISQEEFDYIVLLKDYTNDFEIYDISEVNFESGRMRNDNNFFGGGRDFDN